MPASTPTTHPHILITDTYSSGVITIHALAPGLHAAATPNSVMATPLPEQENPIRHRQGEGRRKDRCE